VQRYESIGVKPNGAGPNSPPLVMQKPTALKVASQTTSSGGNVPNVRMPRVSQTSRGGVTRAGPSLPPADDAATSSTAHFRQYTSPSGLPSPPLGNNRESIWTREVENTNSAALRRPSPQRSYTVSDDPSPSDRQNSQFSFPVRKQTVSSEDTSQPPASPDKPYQGVGKLIDQWQRKTADAGPERTASPRRGGIPARRALPGLVGGGAGRGR